MAGAVTEITDETDVSMDSEAHGKKAAMANADN